MHISYARTYARCLQSRIAVTIDGSLSLSANHRRSLYNNDKSVSQENERWKAAFAKGLRANRDHGESSSTPISAISTKCSLSLVNEATRGQREREGRTRTTRIIAS